MPRTPPPPGLARRVHFREVDREHWPDLVRLFEGRGGPKYCWCMAWRPKPTAGKEDGRAYREWAKEQLGQRVEEGVPIGIVGYLDGEPVAWCSIAPRPTYRGLRGIDEPGEAADTVWSIACFFFVRAVRGAGLVERTIAAAVDLARARGATVVEAYPVDPDSPSYRFMGFVSSFAKAGFTEVGQAGTRRHVLRLRL